SVPEGLETRGEVGVLDLRAGLDPVLAREAAPPGGVQSPTHTTLTAPPQTNGSGVPRRLCDRLPAGRGRRRRDRDPCLVLPRVRPAGPDRAGPRARGAGLFRLPRVPVPERSPRILATFVDVTEERSELARSGSNFSYGEDALDLTVILPCSTGQRAHFVSSN